MFIPNPVIIAGIPYTLRLDRDDFLKAKEWTSTSSWDDQAIAVQSTYPTQRQASYLLNEIAYQLLAFAGWTEKEVEPYKFPFASALYMLLQDNSFEWIRRPKDTPLPDQVTIGCLPYKVRQDQDEYLEAKGLLGEVPYTSLELKAKTTLPPEIRAWVLVHEMTHAILYESSYDGDHNSDKLITPLGTLIYLLLRDNDFTNLVTNQEEGSK